MGEPALKACDGVSRQVGLRRSTPHLDSSIRMRYSASAMDITMRNYQTKFLCAVAAPVYGDPLAGLAAFKCRVLTPNMHFDPINRLRRG